MTPGRTYNLVNGEEMKRMVKDLRDGGISDSSIRHLIGASMEKVYQEVTRQLDEESAPPTHEIHADGHLEIEIAEYQEARQW